MGGGLSFNLLLDIFGSYMPRYDMRKSKVQNVRGELLLDPEEEFPLVNVLIGRMGTVNRQLL